MKLVNLTPHTLNVYAADKTTELFSVPSSGTVRVATTELVVGDLNGVPVVKTEYGACEGLPAPEDGTTYIVSILVLQALNGTRNDVVAPNTSPKAAVRSADGKILGVTGFTVITE